jgi:hypothetical protein
LWDRLAQKPAYEEDTSDSQKAAAALRNKLADDNATYLSRYRFTVRERYCGGLLEALDGFTYLPFSVGFRIESAKLLGDLQATPPRLYDCVVDVADVISVMKLQLREQRS